MTSPPGVIIVEDSWFLAAQVEAWLEDEGIAVLGSAASVGAAMALTDSTSPDIAIVDYNLRGQSARPLIDHLLKRSVKVVVVTGYSEIEATGVERVLQKPCAKQELLDALHAAGMQR